MASLAHHNCIVLRQFDGDYAVWRFTKEGKEYVQKVRGDLSSNDGETGGITRWTDMGLSFAQGGTFKIIYSRMS
ncbi:hypothetical protein [Rouxiella sp. S1S-2]|uniref:hypothetical protein n=1 Tax=Rouxiella sp. S1S-2 TaxID=2653856 RepID=UPI001D00BF72|nr:hypothetical protein [Rouxiella sp. S1S-2]